MTSSDGTTAVPGGRLAWRSQGAGPLAVWAHGLTQSGRSHGDAGMFDWGPVGASGRRLLWYDARGHGASLGEADPGTYTWSALAGDLLALLDALAPALLGSVAMRRRTPGLRDAVRDGSRNPTNT